MIKDRPRVDFKEKTSTGNPAVDYCEENYPATCNEFKKIMNDQYLMFCKKQKNYGPGNISVGTNLETTDDIKLSLTGLWFRMNDKIQRLKQLIILRYLPRSINIWYYCTDSYCKKMGQIIRFYG